MSLTQSGILGEIPIGVSMEEIDRVEQGNINYEVITSLDGRPSGNGFFS